MARVNVKEGWRERQGGGELRRRYCTRAFSVLTSDPADDMLVAAAAGDGIPATGEAHPDDPEMLCYRVYARPRGPILWDVFADYSGLIAASVFTGIVTWRNWTWDRRNVPMTRDVNGNAIVNAVGEPFDPPVPHDVSDPVLIGTRPEPVISPAFMLTYNDTVNSDVWFGCAPGQAKLNIVANTIEEENIYYWMVEYTITFRADGWTIPILNQGTRKRAKDGAGAVIYDADGNVGYVPAYLVDASKPVEPRRLTLAGDLLPDGAPDVFISWQDKAAVPFFPLRLL